MSKEREDDLATVSKVEDNLASVRRQQAETQLRLSLANRHISTLYSQVQDLEVQFKTAIKHKKHSARYNLRQKLAVIMGMKIVYLNYCSVKSQELERLEQKIRAASGQEEEAMDTDSSEEQDLAIAELRNVEEMGDSESEYEEEETLLTVELHGVIDSEIFAQDSFNKFKILAIDSERPILQVENFVFTGEYEHTLGTAVFFEEEEKKVKKCDPVFCKKPARMLKYVCKTNKKLNMKRVFVSEKTASEESASVDKNSSEETTVVPSNDVSSSSVTNSDSEHNEAEPQS